MLIGTIEISGETLQPSNVKTICSSLTNHQVRLFSLRNCEVSDKDMKRIMRSTSQCKSILQLVLNIGIVSTRYRLELLVQSLQMNRSLTSVLLHGNHIGDDGMKLLVKGLSSHPNISILDLGDCHLGNEAVDALGDLLTRSGPKCGLKELSLSANPSITSTAWAKLAVSVALNDSLKSLYMDYNRLNDYGGSCLVMAVVTNKSLEVLDLEATMITQVTAQLLLEVLQNSQTRLKKVSLLENKINAETLEEIADILLTVTDVITEESSIVSDSDATDSHSIIGGGEENPSPIEVKLKTIHTLSSAHLRDKMDSNNSQIFTTNANLCDSDDSNTGEHDKVEEYVKALDDADSELQDTAGEVSHVISTEKNEKNEKFKSPQKKKTDNVTVDEEFGEELHEIPMYEPYSYA